MPNRALLFFFAAVGAISSPFVMACNAAGLGPTPPITSPMLDGGRDASPDGAVANAAPDDAGAFFACATTDDCVAVPKNGCCDNGFMEAVNKGSVDAYKASFTCATKQVCPMFRINDSRTVRCGASTHACELVRAPGTGLPTPP